jgi:hypothetical protein
VRQVKGEEVELALQPTNEADRLTKPIFDSAIC